MTIYLTRHAQSEYNAKGLLNSDPNVFVGLTDIGIQQAQQLAEKLHSEPIEVIYASELPRTQQTASIINEELHKPIVIDPLLNENKMGFEGKPLDDWFNALAENEDGWNMRFNGGESMADALKRTKHFVEKLKQSKHASILVVTHGFHVEALIGLSKQKDGPNVMGQLVPQGQFATLTF